MDAAAALSSSLRGSGCREEGIAAFGERENGEVECEITSPASFRGVGLGHGKCRLMRDVCGGVRGPAGDEVG